jgi:hypothetical protein
MLWVLSNSNFLNNGASCHLRVILLFIGVLTFCRDQMGAPFHYKFAASVFMQMM